MERDPFLRSWNFENANPKRVILNGLDKSMALSNSRITIFSSFSWPPSTTIILPLPNCLNNDGKMFTCFVSRWLLFFAASNLRRITLIMIGIRPSSITCSINRINNKRNRSSTSARTEIERHESSKLILFGLPLGFTSELSQPKLHCLNLSASSEPNFCVSLAVSMSNAGYLSYRMQITHGTYGRHWHEYRLLIRFISTAH